DYTDIRSDHPGERTATTHLALNLIVVGLCGVNLGIRSSLLNELQTPIGPFVLSVIAIVLLPVSGYLGGRLVYAAGISVGRHKRRTPTPTRTLHFTAQENGDMTFVAIPEASRLGEEETLRVKINGEVLTIAKIDNNFYAFQEFCTHRFGPLSKGGF